MIVSESNAAQQILRFGTSATIRLPTNNNVLIVTQGCLRQTVNSVRINRPCNNFYYLSIDNQHSCNENKQNIETDP